MFYIACVLSNSCVLCFHTASGFGNKHSIKDHHSGYVQFCLQKEGFSLEKMLFKLLGLLVHSGPMSSIQEEHRTQGEPIVRIHPFVH